MRKSAPPSPSVPQPKKRCYKPSPMARRILYVVTEDWYFLSHRLPMARAAKAAGYEVHVATRLKDGGAAIEKEGFVPHALAWSRGSLSLRGSLAAILALRRLLKDLRPAILHNVALKPVLLGTTASLGLSATGVVNSLTGLGSLFIGEAKVNGSARAAVRYTLSRLLRRKRSRTIVQNPDDRAFVDRTRRTRGERCTYSGLWRRHQSLHASAGAAAARHRRLCRSHAR